MQCRRCGKELPIGSRKTCPFCGITLDTYITPRDHTAKPPRKPGKRATKLSFLSVAFVVAIIFIVIPVLRNINKKDLLNKIEAYYLELEQNETEYDETEWELRLLTLSAMVHRFESSYPTDEENTEKITRYIYALCGLDPDNAENPEEIDEQQAYNERLINKARESIIDVTTIALEGPDRDGNCSLTVKAKNLSGQKEITQVALAFEVYDVDGNPANDTTRGTSVAYVKLPNIAPEAEAGRVFLTVWNNPDISYVKLLWMNVIYSDDESLYFPPEVCSVLWN